MKKNLLYISIPLALIVGIFLIKYVWLISRIQAMPEHECLGILYFAFDLITLVILIATILFLGKQNEEAIKQTESLSQQTMNLSQQINEIQEQTKILRGDAYYKMALLTVEIDKLFIDKPHLKPYFYKNREVEEGCSETERDLIETYAEFTLDTFDALVFLAKENRIPNEDWIEWKNAMQDMFKASPAMREFYRNNKHCYGNNLGPIFGT